MGSLDPPRHSWQTLANESDRRNRSARRRASVGTGTHGLRKFGKALIILAVVTVSIVNCSLMKRYVGSRPKE